MLNLPDCISVLVFQILFLSFLLHEHYASPCTACSSSSALPIHSDKTQEVNNKTLRVHFARYKLRDKKTQYGDLHILHILKSWGVERVFMLFKKME